MPNSVGVISGIIVSLHGHLIVSAVQHSVVSYHFVFTEKIVVESHFKAI